MKAVEHVVVHLLAGYKADGDRVVEAVPATPAGEPSTFRLTATPGLVEGAAAEDIVRVQPDGSFDVVHRGGNLAIQVFARGLAEDAYSQLDADAERLGGYLDGGGGAHRVTVRVYTIPVGAGFPAVEAVFNSFAAEHPEAEWSFGNVYEAADGVTPLNWWQQ